MGTFERKHREIQKSLHRRARLRRAYFKILGEETKGGAPKLAEESGVGGEKAPESTSLSGSLPNAKDSTASHDTAEQESPPAKLTGRQKARKLRAEKFHLEKEKALSIKKAKDRRISHKKTMTKTTKKGQPRLGFQMGVLLDKIKSKEA